MRLFQFAFKFYINASIHVALAVVSFFAITVLEFNLQVSLGCLFFVFSGTVTGYNFVKYAKIAGLHHRSLTNSLRSIQVFSLVCLTCFLVCTYFVSPQTLWITGFFGLLTFLYAVPLLKKKNLRTFSGLKIIVVALVWSGVTVFVPLVEAGVVLTTDCWLTFFQRFLLVIVLTLPFEIRDLRYDLGHLQTIPQRIGLQKTKILGVVFLLLALWLENLKETLVLKHLYYLLFLAFATSLALLLARKKQSRYFAAFWVESIPIVGLLVLLLFGHFFT